MSPSRQVALIVALGSVGVVDSWTLERQTLIGAKKSLTPLSPWLQKNHAAFSAAGRVGAPVLVLQSSTKPSTNEDDNSIDRTTFDQAGASLIEEEDRVRMEQMGDFDANPAYQTDNIERMREAIRARTASMGLEKSRVSAEYIESRKEKAIQGGPSGQSDPDQFAGLDLSKISTSPSTPSSSNQWNEEMPSMFYDPEDELSIQEQEDIDPVMKLNPLEQALNELRNAKWPDFGSAFREVLLMLVVVALSAVLIIGWDKILRELYTSAGFIPTKAEIVNYASRFDGLDLPKGWTDNMSEQDVTKFADTVNMNQQSTTSSMPGL